MRSEEIKSIFGNDLRVRVMGLLVEDDQILLINHVELTEENELWLPPGGGVELGESVKDALKREFREETNLDVEVHDFLGVNEFINPPLHAIELLFKVERTGGTLALGSDPETGGHNLLREARWIAIHELNEIRKSCLYSLFHDIKSIDELFAKRGFFNLGNNP